MINKEKQMLTVHQLGTISNICDLSGRSVSVYTDTD